MADSVDEAVADIRMLIQDFIENELKDFKRMEAIPPRKSKVPKWNVHTLFLKPFNEHRSQSIERNFCRKRPKSLTKKSKNPGERTQVRSKICNCRILFCS